MKKVIVLLMFLLTIGCSNLDENDLKVFLKKENFSPTLTVKYDDGYHLIRENENEVTMYFLEGKSKGRFIYSRNISPIRKSGIYIGGFKAGSFTMYVSNKKLESQTDYFKVIFEDGSEKVVTFEKGKKAYRIFDSRIKNLENVIAFYNESGEQIFKY
ncbi:hypothetical protein [Paenibacillus agilis]|uniref:Lipoprotein n=1 Tax=Paenibacillus agilis TaxID=3020863 RepID=A0A559IKI4_9BACL|nr:hypothetical protein [Paenibacillus agilis]TVX88168.1 hypothetical protein FPZ44_19880 [Paenibacillus agilis]